MMRVLLSLPIAAIVALLGVCFAPFMWWRALLGRDLPPVQEITDERDGTLYLWRLYLTPRTRLGGLYWHVFHRGDQDRDHHDHPWWFWTFPLTSYWEEVLEDDGVASLNYVKAFRWHFRPARYRHRVVGSRFSFEHGVATQARGDRRLYTLIYHGPAVYNWGFWVTPCADYDHIPCLRPLVGGVGPLKQWVPHREYNH
jgi:hypothetical protein